MIGYETVGVFLFQPRQIDATSGVECEKLPRLVSAFAIIGTQTLLQLLRAAFTCIRRARVEKFVFD